MLNAILLSILAVYATVAVWGIFLDRQLYARLSAHHTDIWKRLDCPMMWPNTSYRAILAVRGFIRRGEYRGLKDPELNRLATLDRYTEYIGYVLGSVFVLLLFFGKSLGA